MISSIVIKNPRVRFGMRLIMALLLTGVIVVLEPIFFWSLMLPKSLAKDVAAFFLIASPLLGIGGLFYYPLKGGWSIILFLIPIFGALLVGVLDNYLGIPGILNF